MTDSHIALAISYLQLLSEQGVFSSISSHPGTNKPHKKIIVHK